MPPLNIAIIGCGTAGMAAAVFLARAGHRVTLFERFATPQPVGAGLLLQPSGISVLRELGLLDAALAGGAVVRGLEGVNHAGRKVLSLRYQDLGAEHFGVGIHRARLFDVLYRALCDAGVKLCLGANIERITQTGNTATVIADGHPQGHFDLAIAADGSHSNLRKAHGHNGATRAYPWAALWVMVPDPGRQFPDTLMQAYRLGGQMIGVLPAGCRSDGTAEVTLFWSIAGDGYAAWQEAGLDSWKAQVKQLMPTAEPLLDAITSSEQLTFSRYLDVRPKTWVDNRLVYIGDAAHGTSPQLGQGANLALWDAKVLAENLARAPLQQALKMYAAERKATVRYYQWASRWLTPCFQSHGAIIPRLRDTFMHPIGRLPGIHRYSLETLCGLRGGFIRRLGIVDQGAKFHYG